MKHMSCPHNKLYIASFVTLIVALVSVAGVFADDVPKGVTQSNIYKDRFVVSWTTEDVTQAQINYGTTSALGNTVYDVRGQTSEGTTHYIQATGLAVSTVYYYDIVCGGIVYDNGGAHYTITTGPALSAPANSDIAYGQVFLDDGVTPAKDSIVYVKLRDNNGTGTSGDSQLFSYLVDYNGYWYMDLKNIKTTSLSAYFDYSSGDNLVITTKGTNGGTAILVSDTASSSPAPSITIPTNTPPALDWTGDAGYESGGLSPLSGSGTTVFTFKIKYTDIDGNIPTIHKVYIDMNGDGNYSAFDMTTTGTDYASGVIYTYTTAIPYSQTSQSHSYYFEFSDGTQFATGNISQAINAATAIHKPDVFQTLSLTIDHTIWQLLNIAAGSEQLTDASNKIMVTNNGDGPQTYSLNITDQGGWTASADKNGVGINTFVLSAIFTGDTDIGINSAYFNEIGNDDVVLAGSADRATSVRFGSSRLLQNGVSVPAGIARGLWLDLKAPSRDTTQSVIHSVGVTINAEAS